MLPMLESSAFVCLSQCFVLFLFCLYCCIPTGQESYFSPSGPEAVSPTLHSAQQSGPPISSQTERREDSGEWWSETKRDSCTQSKPGRAGWWKLQKKKKHCWRAKIKDWTINVAVIWWKAISHCFTLFSSYLNSTLMSYHSAESKNKRFYTFSGWLSALIHHLSFMLVHE